MVLLVKSRAGEGKCSNLQDPWNLGKGKPLAVQEHIHQTPEVRFQWPGCFLNQSGRDWFIGTGFSWKSLEESIL